MTDSTLKRNENGVKQILLAEHINVMLSLGLNTNGYKLHKIVCSLRNFVQHWIVYFSYVILSSGPTLKLFVWKK